MKSHIPGEDKFYQCPECQLKICSLSKLLRHDRKFHTGFKDYECKICEAEVTDIAVHMRVSLSKNQKINKKFLLILYFFYGLLFFNCSLKNSEVCKILICNYASQIFFFCLFCRFTEQKSNLPATFANCNSVTKIHWFAIFSNIQEKDHFGAKIANLVSLQLTGSKNTSRKSIRILQPPNP